MSTLSTLFNQVIIQRKIFVNLFIYIFVALDFQNYWNIITPSEFKQINPIGDQFDIESYQPSNNTTRLIYVLVLKTRCEIFVNYLTQFFNVLVLQYYSLLTLNNIELNNFYNDTYWNIAKYCPISRLH